MIGHFEIRSVLVQTIEVVLLKLQYIKDTLRTKIIIFVMVSFNNFKHNEVFLTFIWDHGFTMHRSLMLGAKIVKHT